MNQDFLQHELCIPQVEVSWCLFIQVALAQPFSSEALTSFLCRCLKNDLSSAGVEPGSSSSKSRYCFSDLAGPGHVSHYFE